MQEGRLAEEAPLKFFSMVPFPGVLLQLPTWKVQVLPENVKKKKKSAGLALCVVYTRKPTSPEVGSPSEKLLFRCVCEEL